jgi:hypothetical protein
MRAVRPAIPSDLASLEELYFHLNPNRPPLSRETAERIFDQILRRSDCHLFVSSIDAALVATCMLATVPNLMRGGQPHALLENVVTHPASSPGTRPGRGHGRSHGRLGDWRSPRAAHDRARRPGRPAIL